MGVSLPRPFGRYGMFDKFPKISLDYSLLDAEGIMIKNVNFVLVIISESPRLF